MAVYHTIQIQDTLIAEIDRLLALGYYSSRAEYVKELIRNDMKRRGKDLDTTK